VQGQLKSAKAATHKTIAKSAAVQVAKAAKSPTSAAVSSGIRSPPPAPRSPPGKGEKKTSPTKAPVKKKRRPVIPKKKDTAAPASQEQAEEEPPTSKRRKKDKPVAVERGGATHTSSVDEPLVSLPPGSVDETTPEEREAVPSCLLLSVYVYFVACASICRFIRTKLNLFLPIPLVWFAVFCVCRIRTSSQASN
jgi:hypothetical protein